VSQPDIEDLVTAATRPDGLAVADPALVERVEDHLRPTEVRAAFERAQGTGDEAVRLAHRARARLFLDRVAADQSRELAARGAFPEGRDRDFELASGPSAALRREAYASWLAEEDELQSLRSDWAAVREEGCCGVGAESVTAWLAAEHPLDPAALVAPFETGAIAPLDAAMGAAAREPVASGSAHILGPAEPAEVPRARTLWEHHQRFATAAVAPVLRRLGAVLGADPDAGGPVLLDPDPRNAWPEARPVGPTGATVRLGALAGPAALRSALGQFGRSARALFVASLRGNAGALWSDPAFDSAAEVLFRRLVLNRDFREQHGPARNVELDRALRYEEALAPRLAWTYLDLVLRRSGRSGSATVRDGEIGRAFQRAGGRPATLDQRIRLHAGDPVGAALLRGTVLALLLEERLLSRLGRGWYAVPAARGLLREFWEAEAEQTAESVASALGVGTIEPTPVLDRCRP